MKCLGCTSEFTPSRKWSKFCSTACRQKFWIGKRQRKVKITCPHCGEIIKTAEINVYKTVTNSSNLKSEGRDGTERR